MPKIMPKIPSETLVTKRSETFYDLSGDLNDITASHYDLETRQANVDQQLIDSASSASLQVSTDVANIEQQAVDAATLASNAVIKRPLVDNPICRVGLRSGLENSLSLNGVSLTRNAARSYVDPYDGVMKIAGNNELVFTKPAVGPVSLSLEMSATNIADLSEKHTSIALGTVCAPPPVDDLGISADLTVTRWRYDDATTGSCTRDYTVPVDLTSWTVSREFKGSGAVSFVGMGLVGVDSILDAVLDIGTGIVSGVDAGRFVVTSLATGGNRVSVTFSNNGTASVLSLSESGYAGLVSFESGRLQVENSAYETSYIRTTTAGVSVTRSTDKSLRTGDVIPSGSWTLAVSFYAKNSFPSNNLRVFSANDGGRNVRTVGSAAYGALVNDLGHLVFFLPVSDIVSRKIRSVFQYDKENGVISLWINNNLKVRSLGHYGLDVANMPIILFSSYSAQMPCNCWDFVLYDTAIPDAQIGDV